MIYTQPAGGVDNDSNVDDQSNKNTEIYTQYLFKYLLLWHLEFHHITKR